MASKEELNRALDAWSIARDRAELEQKAWGTLLKSQGSFIESLRTEGHTWTEAEAEFAKFSTSHLEAWTEAYKNAERLCAEYWRLKREGNKE